ncbi:MAG: hypothetical protein NWE99_04930 [Candidatus Bathyarchaeota archaeon]|nr:hypothetical protein [Candidatus Bathyarchaeota archaeon]
MGLEAMGIAQAINSTLRNLKEYLQQNCLIVQVCFSDIATFPIVAKDWANVERLNLHYFTLFLWAMGLVDNGTKAFHFIEADWLIYFPACGNQGKYVGYSVLFSDRKSGTAQPVTSASLGELLDRPEISERYPHTVGYFKTSGESLDSAPEYLELRIIRSVEEFWAFLNSVDI